MPKSVWLVCEDGSFLVHAVSLQVNGLVVSHGDSSKVVIPATTDKQGKYVPAPEAQRQLMKMIGDSIMDGTKRIDIRSLQQAMKTDAPAAAPVAKATPPKRAKATASKKKS